MGAWPYYIARWVCEVNDVRTNERGRTDGLVGCGVVVRLSPAQTHCSCRVKINAHPVTNRIIVISWRATTSLHKMTTYTHTHTFGWPELCHTMH